MRTMGTGAVALLLAVGLASCGNSAPPHVAAPTTTTSSLPAPEITTPTTIIDGHSYVVPTEGDSRPIDSYTDSGQQIVLSPKGFLPFHLLVVSNVPVTWTNLTSTTVTLAFGHSGLSPKVLKPGAAYTYPGTGLLSFIVTSSTGYHMSVSIGAFTS
jgi:hypothetical protein